MPVDEQEPLEKARAETNSRLDLYGKLAKIAGELTWVEKTGYNQAQNYSYVTAENVADSVRGKLSTHGITFLPSCLETEVRPSVTGKQQVTKVKMLYVLVDSETGQKHEATWYGEGADSADKGLSKAYTAAQKYFFIDLFQIPTGKDPDAGDTARQSRAAQTDDSILTPTNRKKVLNAVQSMVTPEDWTMFRTSLGIESDESLTVAHAKQVRAWLDKKDRQ